MRLHHIAARIVSPLAAPLRNRSPPGALIADPLESPLSRRPHVSPISPRPTSIIPHVAYLHLHLSRITSPLRPRSSPSRFPLSSRPRASTLSSATATTPLTSPLSRPLTSFQYVCVCVCLHLCWCVVHTTTLRGHRLIVSCFTQQPRSASDSSRQATPCSKQDNPQRQWSFSNGVLCPSFDSPC